MIKISSPQDALQVATLHMQSINEGFLPKLGIGFLQSLYSFLIEKELVIVFEEKEKIMGFVSCALSSKGIKKRFLFSSPMGIFKLVLALLKNPKLINPLLETYRAPSLSESDPSEKEIPETELLSISVSSLAQKRGIGSKLIVALEEALKNRDISTYKVIAGEKLVGANKFYIKTGFTLAKQITIHGNDVSNVYVKYL